jgi:hypothetical protein
LTTKLPPFQLLRMKKRPQPDLYVKKRVGTKDKPKRRPNSKKSANVEWYARELIDQLGPFICLGKQWWTWNASIWNQVDASQYSRHAFLIQPPSHGDRSVRMASNILTAMSHLCQCDPQKILWRGGVWFDEKQRGGHCQRAERRHQGRTQERHRPDR